MVTLINITSSTVATARLFAYERLKNTKHHTVPPETIDPFAAFFSRSIRGSTPRFHLANNAACRKNSSVLPKFTAACDSAVKEVPR